MIKDATTKPSLTFESVRYADLLFEHLGSVIGRDTWPDLGWIDPFGPTPKLRTGLAPVTKHRAIRVTT